MNIRKMNQEEKVKYMVSAPVNRLIVQMAVPTIISMLVTSFYNMADTFFVGKINNQATGAVGVVFSVMALIQACGFFFGHGSGNFISRKLGAGEYEEANAMAATGFFLAFGAGVLAMLGGLVFLEPLAKLLGSTPTILPYTMDYLRFILFGAPFMMSSLVLNNQLRFQGSASYAMVGIVTGAVINIVLDPVLIFVFQMGVAGASLATVISQISSFLILLFMGRRGGNIRIHIKNFSCSPYYLKEICRGGFPSLCRQGLGSVAQISLNRVAGTYGMLAGGKEYADAAIAAMSVVHRVSMFANSALIGFGQGFQPVCGMNYGAKKPDRVREGFFFCVKYATLFLVVISMAGFIFAGPVVAVFRDDARVVEIGTLALRLHCVAFPLNGWIVMSNMLLQALGKGVRASVSSSARQGLFFLPLIWVLPIGFGLLGVQMAQPVADVCTFLFTFIMVGSVLKELKRCVTEQ